MAVDQNFKIKHGLEVTDTVSASGLAGSLLSSRTPLIEGTATPGTSTIPARDDHVHPSYGGGGGGGSETFNPFFLGGM